MTTEKKSLSLFDSTAIIIGSMIGSGIFIVSAEIARQVETPGMLLLAWAVTAVITIFGALSYGELAAAMPKAGGQYIYLKEAYGPMYGFLYGWTLFSVIQTGTIAAVGVAFAKFTGVFLPVISGDNYILHISSFHISTQQLLAISIIILLTLYNFMDVKAGAFLQNIFTVSKVIALLLLVILGLYFGMQGAGNWSNFSPAFPDIITLSTIGIFGAAMTGSLFSADAWNNITYTAGEVHNPKRNLPLSLFIGTGTVMVLYLLANIAYIYVLPIEKIQHAENDRVATLMMETVLGTNGKFFMAIMIMVSTFGCLNGLILTAARVYYAMAKDGLFLPKAAKLNKNNVPANSLIMQCIWSCLLCFSGTYGDLLNYIMFAVMLFYVLTITGLFILRKKRPDMERPYKAFGYPVIPALYILMAAMVAINMLIYQTSSSLYGLIIILIGIPIYFVFKKSSGEGLNQTS
ncbi:MAG: amino acid permease [Bacteroidetes bacterium]|nr:amino acid permease [Bacteroidota bacterium]MBK9540887.1 amino acid permease [Bacteroidota bacterium]MBL0259233.1 amino acid permease [Bacteroidota bacterium]MBP6402558.1 amino acid permease [Bacteroidia bacterium]MBP6648530.1 amino acid permease [Bacteroidia bacterium]